MTTITTTGVITGVTIPEGSTYAEFREVPAYAAAVRDATGGLVPPEGSTSLWSGPHAVPAIGAAVTVTINGIGPAEVLGYFVEHGWLGLLVRPSSPPDWYIRKNGAGAICHVFGVEFEPAAPPQAVAAPLEAHYSAASAAIRARFPKSKGVVQFAVTRDGQRDWHGTIYPVSGKREARKLAADHNATPWNF